MTLTVTVTVTATQNGRGPQRTWTTTGVPAEQLADTAEIVAAQDLADRVFAMLTKLIRSV